MRNMGAGLRRAKGRQRQRSARRSLPSGSQAQITKAVGTKVQVDRALQSRQNVQSIPSGRSSTRCITTMI